jgi:hypothetical protein
MRILAKLDEMGINLGQFPHHQMTGSDRFRLRVGNYRVIHKFDVARNEIQLSRSVIDEKSIAEVRSRRQPQARHAAVRAFAVGEGERAAVVFRDLAAEYEADAAAFGFRREKRDEKIRRLRDARAVVLDRDLGPTPGLAP